MRNGIPVAALLIAACVLSNPSAFADDAAITPKAPSDKPTPEKSSLAAKESAKQSIATLKIEAENGDASAQETLGFFYSGGVRDFPQDFKEAAKWFRKSAEQGNAEAQCSLGGLYSRGEGVPQDFKEATKWYRKAAEQGNAKAQNVLGNFLSDSKNTQQDYKEAAKWYRKSAEQGDAKAQCSLGEMFYDGNGVQQDFVSAYCFFNLSASKENFIEAAGLKIDLRDLAVESRRKATAKLTAKQVADAQSMSSQWVKDHPKEVNEEVKKYEKLAEQGNAAAQVLLGTMLYNGTGTPQDYKNAMKWYRKAAEQGNATAQICLGNMFSNGSVPQDLISAHCFFNLAARNKNPNAVQLRNQLAEKLTPKQLADAQAMAAKWAKDHPTK